MDDRPRLRSPYASILARLLAIEGDQCRSVGDRTAPAAAEPGGGGSASQQDRAHRLGGDAAREGIPAQGYGRLVACGTGAGACECLWHWGWSLRESNDA